MIQTINPLLLTDGYKLSHRPQYPYGTSFVDAGWIARKSRIKGINRVINFGMQYLIKEYLIDKFNEYFFGSKFEREAYNYDTPNGKKSVFKESRCKEYQRHVEKYLGVAYDIKHIEALWDLGYLPIEIKSLPEGTRVPIGTPMFTIHNTLPEFFWIVNYLETLISDTIWLPMTSATIAYEYRKIFEKWADITGCKTDIIPNVLSNIDIQGHDFSMRGMGGSESAIMSGMAHLTSFKGTDTIPAIIGLEKYYNAKDDFVGCSVPATEHSVMCAGEKDSELDTFKRLITEVYPTGVLSVVSDTWDLWKVLTEYLPKLKEIIMNRDGKVVIRPDSGDPIDILCGINIPEFTDIIMAEYYFKNNLSVSENIFKYNDKYYVVIIHNGTDFKYTEVECKPQYKGVIELLWDIFGGTINKKGYKVLDQHIGAIYGDAITMQRADEICKRLEAKGFASCNWVAGIGSYTYQYNTRDTFGFALKTTYVEIQEVVSDDPFGDNPNNTHIETICREVFKDPITDNGTKKSLKGLVRVNEDLSVTDQCTKEEEKQGLLKTIFYNGMLIVDETLSDIRKRIEDSKD